MTTFSQLAYAHIRNQLERGQLGRRGELSEPAIARELGFSRTPVREAIRQLASEGLLEQRARQGTFIRRPTRRDLVEVYELRQLLEPCAAAAVARVGDEPIVRQLERLLSGMHALAEQCRGIDDETGRGELLLRHSALDLGFHLAILQAAGNSRIVKIVSDARILSQAMAFPRDSRQGVLTSMAIAYREHRRILRAIAGKDERASDEAMAAHVTAARDRVLEYVDSSGGWNDDDEKL